MSLMGILIDHWRLLAGSVHPYDEPIFNVAHHSFNLDYPPPAYVGDVEQAPAILLMANGGFNVKTADEFREAGSVQRYIERLHNPKPVDPAEISPYYDAGNYGDLIKSGKLALINAVAYRSKKISDENENKSLAKRLPSTLLHHRWLKEEMIPQAISGKRLIIAHRNGLWPLRKWQVNHPNIIFSPNPNSPYLTHKILDRIRDFSDLLRH